MTMEPVIAFAIHSNATPDTGSAVWRSIHAAIALPASTVNLSHCECWQGNSRPACLANTVE
jgi:hypothetical protein